MAGWLIVLPLLPFALIGAWALYRAIRAGIEGERKAVAEYHPVTDEDGE